MRNFLTMSGGHRLLAAIVLASYVLATASAAPQPRRVRRAADTSIEFELNPVAAVDQELSLNEVNRNKRKVTETFAAKNAILGYVFGASTNLVGASSSRQTSAVTASPPVSTTTDDTPDFDRSKVSLDVPDALFGSSFNTVTTVSKLFGDLMMNSARRYAQFVQYLKPVLGKTLTVKGFDVRPTISTTTEYLDLDLE